MVEMAPQAQRGSEQEIRAEQIRGRARADEIEDLRGQVSQAESDAQMAESRYRAAEQQIADRQMQDSVRAAERENQDFRPLSLHSRP